MSSNGLPRSLAILQIVFSGLVISTIIVVVVHEQAFAFPGSDFRSFLIEAPGLIASVVGFPLLLLGTWLWLTRGSTDATGFVRKLIAERIAPSRGWLSIAIAGLFLVSAWLGYRVLASETIRLSVAAGDDHGWDLYLDCTEAQHPEECGTPVVLGRETRAFRLVLPARAVLAQVEKRVPVIIEGSTDFAKELLPPAPKQALATGDVIVLYRVARDGAQRSATDIGKEVWEALTRQAPQDPSVTVVLTPEPFSEALAARWAKDGVNPMVALFGSYDDVQVKGTIRAALGNELQLSLMAEEQKSGNRAKALEQWGIGHGSGPVSLMRALIPVDVGERVVIDFERDFAAQALVERFPRLAASYVAMLVGMKRLSEQRDDLADAWLLRSEELSPWSDDLQRQGDEALRVTLLAALAFRRGDDAAGQARLSRAITALERRAPVPRDLIVHGPLLERLPRIVLSVLVNHVTPRFASHLQRVLTPLVDSSDGTAVGTELDNVGAAFEAAAREAAGPEWKRVLRFYGDHYADLFEMSGVRGGDRARAEQLAAKSRELARQADAAGAKGAPQAIVLASEARLYLARAHAEAYGPLHVQSQQQVVDAERAWLDARSKANPGEGDEIREAMEALEQRTRWLSDVKLMLGDIERDVDSLRERVRAFHRDGHLRCGKDFALEGRFSDRNSLRVTLSESFLRRAVGLYANCERCGFGVNLRAFLSDVPELLECP